MSKIFWDELESKQYGKETESNFSRAKVPNGWLVKMYNLDYNDEQEASYGWGYGGLAFVPDPDHKWDGNSL